MMISFILLESLLEFCFFDWMMIQFPSFFLSDFSRRFYQSIVAACRNLFVEIVEIDSQVDLLDRWFDLKKKFSIWIALDWTIDRESRETLVEIDCSITFFRDLLLSKSFRIRIRTFPFSFDETKHFKGG